MRSVVKAEQQRKALELRKAGATYEQIAVQLGYPNKGAAWKDIKAAIVEIIREPAEDVLALELGRLDAMLLGCWTGAKSGDLQAVDRALRIMDRRAAYLGLDAPKRTATEMDMTVTTDSHEQLLDRLSRLVVAAQSGEGDPEPDRG